MGLSIHYSGYILSSEKLTPLIGEVTDICLELGWDTNTFDDDEIKGVSFAPKGSEPVFLTFNKEGRTFSPINIIANEIYDDVRVDKELKFTTSTKTQFAGRDAHISIIKLLKYISVKYLKDFTLMDEGYYWETGDENILSDQFEKYNFYLDKVTDIFSGVQAWPGESIESLSDRIESILKEKCKGFDESK